MMDKNQAKEIIANLVDRFSEQYDSYKRHEITIKGAGKIFCIFNDGEEELKW